MLRSNRSQKNGTTVAHESVMKTTGLRLEEERLLAALRPGKKNARKADDLAKELDTQQERTQNLYET